MVMCLEGLRKKKKRPFSQAQQMPRMKSPDLQQHVTVHPGRVLTFSLALRVLKTLTTVHYRSEHTQGHIV